MSVGGNRRLVPPDRKHLLAANADLCARIAPEKRERERCKNNSHYFVVPSSILYYLVHASNDNPIFFQNLNNLHKISNSKNKTESSLIKRRDPLIDYGL